MIIEKLLVSLILVISTELILLTNKREKRQILQWNLVTIFLNHLKNIASVNQASGRRRFVFNVLHTNYSSLDLLK